MSMVAIFKGFSTVDKIRAPYGVSDADLVKRDLLNEFNTRKGERVMRPNFGSIIWDLLMNPEDLYTEEEIKDDIKRIVEKDPRVEFINTTIFVIDHTIRAEVELRYKVLNTADTLYLTFTNESGQE